MMLMLCLHVDDEVEDDVNDISLFVLFNDDNVTLVRSLPFLSFALLLMVLFSSL